MKTFFRVNHQDTQQGLWYDFNGEFTGLIHHRFTFCMNHRLVMEFDPAIVGYISAVETLQQLFQWFALEDIIGLQHQGFYVHQYQASDFKWYDRFKHYVINQSSSVLVCKIELASDGTPLIANYNASTNE